MSAVKVVCMSSFTVNCYTTGSRVQWAVHGNKEQAEGSSPSHLASHRGAQHLAGAGLTALQPPLVLGKPKSGSLAVKGLLRVKAHGPHGPHAHALLHLHHLRRVVDRLLPVVSKTNARTGCG